MVLLYKGPFFNFFRMPVVVDLDPEEGLSFFVGPRTPPPPRGGGEDESRPEITNCVKKVPM
jgi:hypothetical protein